MPVPYAGVPFVGGGKTYIIPPLSLGQVRANAAHLDTIANPGDRSMMSLFQTDYLPVITAAIQRNYPDVTTEEVEAFADLGNVLDIVTAAMGNSNSPKTMGE